MANQYIIRPAPRQNFEAFVRYVVGLAQGARVETDTSTRPYFVRVNEETYRRWTAALPKRPAPEPEAEPDPAPQPEAARQATQQDDSGDASAAGDRALGAPGPEAQGSAEDPEAAPQAPPRPVAKRAKGRTAGASRKRNQGSS